MNVNENKSLYAAPGGRVNYTTQSMVFHRGRVLNAGGQSSLAQSQDFAARAHNASGGMASRSKSHAHFQKPLSPQANRR